MRVIRVFCQRWKETSSVGESSQSWSWKDCDLVSPGKSERAFSWGGEGLKIPREKEGFGLFTLQLRLLSRCEAVPQRHTCGLSLFTTPSVPEQATHNTHTCKQHCNHTTINTSWASLSFGWLMCLDARISADEVQCFPAEEKFNIKKSTSALRLLPLVQWEW